MGEGGDDFYGAQRGRRADLPYPENLQASFVLTSAPELEAPVMLIMNVAVEAAFFRLPS
jgi:hypothetical protein